MSWFFMRSKKVSSASDRFFYYRLSTFACCLFLKKMYGLFGSGSFMLSVKFCFTPCNG